MEKDKILHLIVSFVLMLIAYSIVQSILIAGVMTFILGFGKEVIIDKKIEKEDIIANIIGICLAILILI